MKLTNVRTSRGFTLIEMIGVLAIIAIIAGALIPKIFEAIRDSRINSTIETYNTLKTAVLDHYAKHGKFADTSGNVYTGSSFDAVLLQENRISAKAADKIPLSTASGSTAAYVNVVTGKGRANSGYALAGDTVVSTSDASYTVELVINGVAKQDARDLSLRLDGPGLSATDLNSDDTKGIVEYVNSTGPTRDVYIYITHQ